MLRAQKLDSFLYRSTLSNGIQEAIRHLAKQEFYGKIFLCCVLS